MQDGRRDPLSCAADDIARFFNPVPTRRIRRQCQHIGRAAGQAMAEAPVSYDPFFSSLSTMKPLPA